MKLKWTIWVAMAGTAVAWAGMLAVAVAAAAERSPAHGTYRCIAAGAATFCVAAVAELCRQRGN